MDSSRNRTYNAHTVKILHVVPTYIPAWRYGGPIVSVHGMCKALVARGHQVDVLTTSLDGPDDSDVPVGVPVSLDGVRIWYFRSRLLRRFAWSLPLARTVWRRCSEYDILHIHALFLWPTLVAARAAMRHGVPYVLSPRGMLVKGLIRRKSRLLKTAWITLFDQKHLERAAALHLTSTAEMAEATRFGFRLPETFVIPNGIDRDETEGPLVDAHVPDAAGGPVLFLGRVNWEKGLDRLVRALAHAPAVQLTIAGNDEDNYRAHLDALAREVGVADRITFTGRVAGERKSTLLREAALLVLPSYQENFGNVVIEALAAGCPVVVTPEVGAAEIVHEAGAGCVVEGDPRILGETLARLLRNRRELREMGRRGRRIVAERFTWDSVGQRVEEMYRRLVPGDGSSEKHR